MYPHLVYIQPTNELINERTYTFDTMKYSKVMNDIVNE